MRRGALVFLQNDFLQLGHPQKRNSARDLKKKNELRRLKTVKAGIARPKSTVKSAWRFKSQPRTSAGRFALCEQCADLSCTGTAQETYGKISVIGEKNKKYSLFMCCWPSPPSFRCAAERPRRPCQTPRTRTAPLLW